MESVGIDFPVYQGITGKTGTLTGILGVHKNPNNREIGVSRFVNG